MFLQCVFMFPVVSFKLVFYSKTVKKQSFRIRFKSPHSIFKPNYSLIIGLNYWDRCLVSCLPTEGSESCTVSPLSRVNLIDSSTRFWDHACGLMDALRARSSPSLGTNVLNSGVGKIIYNFKAHQNISDWNPFMACFTNRRWLRIIWITYEYLKLLCYFS